MVADLIYGGEKFGNAVRALALSEAPLAKRLRHAYIEHCHFAVRIQGGAGPAMSSDLQDRILALDRLLTREGRLTETVVSMSDEEIRKAIYELISIADQIEQETAIATHRP